jgi:hypothetical protein
MPPANGDVVPEVRSLYFDELLAIESYKKATSDALGAADGVADKVVTAAFSIATAYGAVVALVAPKDGASPIEIVAPFACLAIAVVLALVAQSVGVSMVSGKTTAKLVRSTVQSALAWKRGISRSGLVVLAAAMVVAGLVVYDTYRPTAGTKTTVTVWLSTAGTRLVSDACREADVAQITGQVGDLSALSAKRVQLDVDGTQCKAGAGTLILPQAAITIARK